MDKKIIVKILTMVSIIGITITSLVMAASNVLPKFNLSKISMKLGSTQKLSGIINVAPTEYYKLKSSDPSVVAIQDNGVLKALSTGISTLSFDYTMSGDKKEIWCYVEVSQNDSTYSQIDGTVASKIKITLNLGDYTTIIESPSASVPEFPEVTKEGYVLEGWYKDANYITKVQDRERFAKDITLYAKWVTEEEAKKPTVPHSSLYNDIDYHWARNYIESVSYRGLFNGVSEKMFGPDKTMTRAMVITVLGRLDEVEKTGRTTNFKDVPAGSYYEEYVAWGLENKIVSGTSEDTFSPNKEITREEMAVMMANYVKYKKYEYELKPIYFSDVDNISSWAIESVKILNNLGIMKGNADGSYNPKKVATRAEIATVFYNYLNYINS
ncbi:MAG: S-layer homology domain-containing protein [Clostridia bacterium]|nr:S-layer homology domain-containing protein [Clostridia bacterium]